MTPWMYWVAGIVVWMLVGVCALSLGWAAKEDRRPAPKPPIYQPAAVRPRLATMENCGCHLCQEMERNKLIRMGMLPEWAEASHREFKEARNART